MGLWLAVCPAPQCTAGRNSCRTLCSEAALKFWGPAQGGWWPERGLRKSPEGPSWALPHSAALPVPWAPPPTAPPLLTGPPPWSHGDTEPNPAGEAVWTSAPCRPPVSCDHAHTTTETTAYASWLLPDSLSSSIPAPAPADGHHTGSRHDGSSRRTLRSCPPSNYLGDIPRCHLCSLGFSFF